MKLAPGTKLGPYQISTALGAGGMGEVYRARDTALNRDVAIKILPTAFSSDPDRLRRFMQEAQAAAALNHPNILAVFQLGTYEGAPYLVSELLEWETLREQIKRGALSVRKAGESGVQIARGLAAAHEKGIVHRDLKPENLFITKDGKAIPVPLTMPPTQRPDPKPIGTVALDSTIGESRKCRCQAAELRQSPQELRLICAQEQTVSSQTRAGRRAPGGRHKIRSWHRQRKDSSCLILERRSG